MLVGNILHDAFAALGCLVVMLAAGVGLLAWAAVASEPGRIIARRALGAWDRRPAAAPPRPVPDDLRAKERP